MPFHDPTRPYLRAWFAASDGAHVVRFSRLRSGKDFAKLERVRGACIIYTYFAKGFLTRHDGKTHLDPVFVEAVTALCSQPKVWLRTASDLLNRLVAVRNVSLVHSGQRVRIRNCGDAAIEGLTLRAKRNAALRDGSDSPLPACGPGKVILPRLLRGKTVELRTDRSRDTHIEPRLSATSCPANAR